MLYYCYTLIFEQKKTEGTMIFMSKMCVLDEKACTNCGECDICDLDKNKICDNCEKCLPKIEADRFEILIDEIVAGGKN